MHKEYNQWKKVFSNKYILLSGMLVASIIATFIFNFFFSIIVSLPETLAGLKNISIQNPPTFKTFFSTNWFFTIHWKYWYLYVAFYMLMLIIFGLKAYRIHAAFHDLNLGTKGTSRFTTLEEIQEQYKSVKDDSNEYVGEYGIPVIHYEDKVYIDTNNTNTCITATTQSGKTEMFTYPVLDLIQRSGEKPSVIVTDVKGDMLKNTRAEFVRLGYDVHVLNLLNPYQGIAYNPLELIKQAYKRGDLAKAQMLCNTLSYSLFHNPNAKDPMWEESSIALVNALILAVCEICFKSGKPENITMYTLTVMLNELGSNPDEDGYTRLDHFFGSLPPSNPAKLQYGTIQFSQGVTRSGIYTGTMAKLKNYTYDTIARMTAMNTFKIEDLAFGEKPMALFIVYPDWDDSNYTIISTFLSQVNAVLSEKATLTKESKLPRRVIHHFEEVANIPPIEGLARSLAVGLQRGLIYNLVIQNKAQLEEKYGEKMAESIIGNCGNQIFIMSDVMDDAKDFSEKLGVKTVITRDRSGEELSVDKNFSEKEEERPLMLPDELKRLKKGEWVVVRTKKREDLKGNRIVAYPIFASLKEGTHMLHRYEYLMDRFNNPIAFDDMNLTGAHKDIKLEDLLIKFELAVEPKGKSNETTSNNDEEIISNSTESKNSKKFNFIKSAGSTTKEDSNISDSQPVTNEKVFEDRVEIEESEVDIMNELEPVFEEVTPILNAISSDKYNFIKKMAENHLSKEEFQYFLGLESIEELRTFFEGKEKEKIYKQIKIHLK